MDQPEADKDRCRDLRQVLNETEQELRRASKKARDAFDRHSTIADELSRMRSKLDSLKRQQIGAGIGSALIGGRVGGAITGIDVTFGLEISQLERDIQQREIELRIADSKH